MYERECVTKRIRNENSRAVATGEKKKRKHTSASASPKRAKIRIVYFILKLTENVRIELFLLTKSMVLTSFFLIFWKKAESIRERAPS